MNLWLLGSVVCLQSTVATVVPLLPLHPNVRSFSQGAALALLLFGLLPQALLLCSALVLTPALVLGIIWSVFIRESVPKSMNAPLLWCLWLMVYTFLQANGILPIWSLPYLIPIALALPGFKVSDLLLLLPSILSFALGCLWSVPAKWQGLLFGVACGMMLGCISCRKSQTLAGGIAIGVILSFL